MGKGPNRAMSTWSCDGRSAADFLALVTASTMRMAEVVRRPVKPETVARAAASVLLVCLCGFPCNDGMVKRQSM